MIDTAAFGLGGHRGAQCRVLDVIADAMVYGASKAACCKDLDVNMRTVERWQKRRQRFLDRVGVA